VSFWSNRKTYLASGLNTMPYIFGVASGIELAFSRWILFLLFAGAGGVLEYAASVVWMLAYKGMTQDAVGSGPGAP
jgi:hypothetical protein